MDWKSKERFQSIDNAAIYRILGQCKKKRLMLFSGKALNKYLGHVGN